MAPIRESERHHNEMPVEMLIGIKKSVILLTGRFAEVVSNVFFNRGGAKAQRKLVLIMKHLRLLCDSATLRFL
jgi:hypothetical protein